MLGSTALLSKALLSFLIVTTVYFIWMDCLLYIRVHEYHVRPMSNATPYQSMIPCDLNPLCTVTVKGLMLDHPNQFLLTPLAAFVDDILGISRSWTWVTPNAISGFHVLVAIAAGRCVSSDSLSTRRLGVILFQVRTWLDDLDGHVARRRKNILGERSDVGSTGYLVDGICDALGCVALVIGLFYYLVRNPGRRGGYDKLQQLPFSSSTIDSVYVNPKPSPWNTALKNMLLVVGHLLIASIGWNRYISLYQDLLETDDRNPPISEELLYARQTDIFRSGSFWAVVFGWKLINFHAIMDYFLLAIFLDKVWEYARLVRWSAYVIVLLLVYITEFHYLRAYAYVKGPASPFETSLSSSNFFSNQ